MDELSVLTDESSFLILLRAMVKGACCPVFQYNSKHIDDAMSVSEALAKINAKEELVKQHIKVAEEAI
ncbi:hypothetical protein Tco_1028549 [Tanacetum coccineum]|uniref:Uncharacterized protein n=1 Tax=Tanacetum coccineum TaxID=301880 RepID=A0ABQ5G2D7_9ASTR